MNALALRAALFFGGLGAVAALPFVGSAMRADDAERCALDGVAISSGTATQITDSAGRTTPFCCVDCAQGWLSRSGDVPLEILVTDETTGQLVSASDAWFVRSRVVAHAASGCHIHTFALESDALRHIDAYGGILLSRAERPLRLTGTSGRGEFGDLTEPAK